MNKTLRTFIIIALVLLALMVGGSVFLLQTESGQTFLTNRVLAYLQDKLKTEVRAKVKFEIPNWVVLEDVYIADQSKDTLLAGKRLYAKLNMKTLFDNKAHIDQLELKDIRLKIKQNGTKFNYDFIVDAFTSPPNPNPKADSQPFVLSIDKLNFENISLNYQAIKEQNAADIQLKSFKTSFKKFDLARSIYHFNAIDLEGVKANVAIKNFPKSEEKKTISSDTLNLKLGDINLKDISWLASIAPAKIETKGSVEKLETSVERLFLDKTQVALSKLNLKSSYIQYDDLAAPKQASGFDAGHVLLKNLNFDSKDILYSERLSKAKIEKLRFTEKSGLVVNQLRTDLQLLPKQFLLKELYIKTPKTLLDSKLTLGFESLDALTKHYEKANFDLKLNKSYVALSEIALLVPAFKKNEFYINNQAETIFADGLLKGKLGDLSIEKLSLKTSSNTNIALSGNIKGLPNINEASVNLTLHDLSTNKSQIMRLMPAKTLPDSIEIPNNIQLSGNISGKMKDFYCNLQLNSDFGAAAFDGNLRNILADKNQQYVGKITLDNFNVGRMTHQKDLGVFSLNADVEGQGFDVNTLVASLDGTMLHGEIKGYNYQNLHLTGSLQNKLLNIEAAIKDDNANLQLTGKIDLNTQYPKLNIETKINTLNLQKLNLYADNLGFKGTIKLDLVDTDPTHPEGKISISDATLYQDKAIPLGDITANIANRGQEKTIDVNSPFFKLNANGHFDYTNIADIVLTEINKYFAFPNIPYKPTKPDYDFELSGLVNNHPAIRAFVPQLTQLDSLAFKMQFDDKKDTTVLMTFQTPFIEYDSTQIKGVAFRLFTKDSVARYRTTLQELAMGDFRLRRASLGGRIMHNVVNFNFMVRDSVNKPIHSVAGRLQAIGRDFKIGFQKRGALLNYMHWEADSTGYLMITPDGLMASDLHLFSGKQSIYINSAFARPNAPLEIITENINLGQLGKAFLQDSTLIDGALSGNILLSDYTNKPTFVGNLQAIDLKYTQIALGNLSMNAANETANSIKAKGTLLSNENDINISGIYTLNQKNPLDLKVVMEKLGAKTVEAFSGGMLSKARGNLTGDLSIKGSTDNLLMRGVIGFDTVRFVIPQLGAEYTIQKQKLLFEGQQVRLRDFVLQDSLAQKMFVNGTITLNNLPNFAYNLKINANKFMALDAPRQEGSLFFGQGFVNANINVKGVNDKYKVDGDVKIDERSRITLLLPDDVGGSDDINSVVQFIDVDKPKKEEKIETKKVVYDESKNLKSEVIVNLEADDKSELKIIIDELNGDYLLVKGNAQLTTGINTDDALFMQGRYDITEGTYEMTYQLLKKQFKIEKASRSNIVFMGDPTNAEINITAKYNAEAVPYDLVTKNPTENLKKKIPVGVELIMTGQLLKPMVTFNISISDDILNQSEELKTALEELRKDKSRMDKQVFALLMLNRFIPEQASDILSDLNAESFARQSVSKLVSDQLNRLAADVIKGVKLDVNLMSDYTAQSDTRNTNLNVGVSKAFLNDRISVAVGRNFELENAEARSSEIFDNLTVNYNLTSDGRYRFKAYRKNQYQAILEGFVVETGVGFVINMDYDKLKELFKK